jgi:hypothetical protein
MKGQLAAEGCCSHGRARTAMQAAEAVTSTVIKSLSGDPLTMAFQLACRAAANRTTAKTTIGILVREQTMHAMLNRRGHPGQRR